MDKFTHIGIYKKMYFSVENRGDAFYIRDESGDHKHYGFMPEVFFPSQRPSGFTGLENKEELVPITYDNCGEFRGVMKDYRGRSDSSIFGTQNLVTQYMIQNHSNDIDFDSSKIRVFNVDIEVDSDAGFPHAHEAKHPINAITVECAGETYTWGLPPSEGVTYTAPEGINYVEFSTESELLLHWLNFWKVNCPHVLTGWNTDTFDAPYIYYRLKRLFGLETARSLSPWGIVDEKERRGRFEGQTDHIVKIWGVANLDYMKLYQKFEHQPRENYKLDTIAYVELGEKKIDYSEQGNLHKLYRNDYQKFIDYNIQDTLLVARLEEKKQLLELAYTIAYYAKVNYESVFSPIATWESLIYHHLYKEKSIPRIKFKMAEKREKYAGAFVMQPEPAMYEWVVSFDLASLYPSLIRQYNLGIETMVQVGDLPEELHSNYASVEVEKLVGREYDLSALKDNDMCMSANGFYYRNDRKSFLSQLMEDLFNKRVEEKRLMYKAIHELNELKRQPNPDPAKIKELENRIAKHYMFQYSFKILLNSCYGMLGSPASQWYDLRLAESITTSGQLSLKWIIEVVNDRLRDFNGGKDVVVYGDTDSIYLAIGNIVEDACADMSKAEKIEWVDGFCKNVIQKIIDEGYADLFEYMNCPQNTMDMDREIIADRGIWSAKKKYACNVYDKEGERYEKPRPKYMGLEFIKSTLPESTRDKLKELVQDILNGSTEAHIIKRKRESFDEFRNKHINDIALNKAVNQFKKYLDSDGRTPIKGATQGAKAVIAFNNYIGDNDIDLDTIREGAKVKLVELIEPNPAQSPIIAYDTILPEELESFINYNVMFEKTFEKPLKSITTPVGWSLREKHAMEDFI